MSQPQPDLSDQVRELVELRKQDRQLHDRIDELEAAIAGGMTTKELTLEGIGQVTRRKSADRKAWKSEDLIGKLHRMLPGISPNVDMTTGEMESEREKAIRVLTQCAAIGYWRVTALKEYGIDPDEYCETRWGKYKIDVVEGIEDGH